jgi:two-component system cell cycle sensor histidine kinase/response regulator CckA
MNDVHNNDTCGARSRRERRISSTHAEEINRVLYAIADAVNASEDLDALYRTIHLVLGTVIDATNFFIAIVDQRQRTLFFPYYVDEVDEDFSPLTDFDASDSLTGLVVTEKLAVFLDSQALRARAARKGIWGPTPLVWLGVPLIIRDEVIGVMAVQHYSDAHRYSREDLRLLMAISHQTAVAIDRKRSLEQLKKSEETYRNMFLGAPVGLFSIALDNGILLECNDAMAAMLGFVGRQHCLGSFCLTIDQGEQEAKSKMDELWPTGELFNSFEAPLLRRDGSVVWLRLAGRIDRANDRLEGVAEDITGLRATEAERLALQEKLHRSKKMEALGLLAGSVAHDLNNMLVGIINYPQLMLMKLDPSDALVAPVKAIQAAGQRIATVVDDLLTMARSAAVVREVHNLNELVEEYFISPESRALLRRHAELQVDLQMAATRANILCSPVHVRKCLMNLFTNAVEATAGKGRIRITTGNRSASAVPIDPGEKPTLVDWVSLEVHDNGSGIATADLDHIFEPFYSRKVMGNSSGTGLGLAVVWNTMQEHGGKVRAVSDEQGTVFSLLFPSTSEAMVEGLGNFDPYHAKGNGETLLVVDDEPQLREVTCSILSAMGYTVTQAASGEEAVEMLRRRPVDLIILDMLMAPGWNGRHTYEEILRINPRQKAILVSGYAENEDVRACLALGVGAFLKKPYSLEHLCGAVRDELSR